ncbi:MAG: hypothetical protein JXB14_02010 [Candidatus Altiarchaeota archaeon]|nr:hypothetical protein [Candidatus Altiarchaeota archaeon]
MNKRYSFLTIGLLVAIMALVLILSRSDPKDSRFNECMNLGKIEMEPCLRNLAIEYEDSSLCLPLSGAGNDNTIYNFCLREVAKGILKESSEKAKNACALMDSTQESQGCYSELQALVSG